MKKVKKFLRDNAGVVALCTYMAIIVAIVFAACAIKIAIATSDLPFWVKYIFLQNGG